MSIFGTTKQRVAIDVRSNESTDATMSSDRIWAFAGQVIDVPAALTSEEVGEVVGAAVAKVREIVSRRPSLPTPEAPEPR